MSLTYPSQPLSLFELVEKACAARGLIWRIYLHWTAGRYEQCFDDYHLNIGPEGQLYLTCDKFTDLKAHTWRRNSHAIGITLCCCYEATTHLRGNLPLINFGPYPPTVAQIESMAKAIAVISHALGLDISPETVLTHEEVARQDGYGPGSGDPETRWDLWYLPNLPMTAELTPGGQVLRGKALWYQQQFYKT